MQYLREKKCRIYKKSYQNRADYKTSTLKAIFEHCGPIKNILSLEKENTINKRVLDIKDYEDKRDLF